MISAGNLLSYLYLRYVRRIVTPAQLLDFACRRFGGRTVLAAGDRTFTLAELDASACGLAHALHARGLAPGQTLGVLLRNVPEFIIARMAAYKAGLVFSALIDDFDSATRVEVLKEVDARAFLFDDRAGADEIEELRRKTSIERFVAVGGTPQLGVERFDDLAQPWTMQGSIHVARPGDVAAIGFTSGATGRSKGVVWGNRAWLNSFYHFLLNRDRATGTGSVILHTLPFSTAGSLGILPGLASGALNVIRPDFDATAALELVPRRRVNRMLTAPIFLMDFWDAYEAGGRKHDLRSLETVTVGSAPMPAAKAEEIIRGLGPVLEQGYGMSEVLAPLARIRVSDPEGQAELLHSVGRPIPQVGLRIEQPDGEGRGRIAIRSSTQALGYWKRRELTKETFKGEWFLSGDVGRLDGEGNLYVLDRAGACVERGGRRVYFREVEECVYRFPGVKECAVVGDGGQLRAYVTMRGGAKPDGAAVREFCAARMPGGTAPDRVIAVDRLPRSTSGKMLKRALVPE